MCVVREIFLKNGCPLIEFFQNLLNNVPVGYRIFYHHFFFKFLEILAHCDQTYIVQKWKIVMLGVKTYKNCIFYGFLKLSTPLSHSNVE